jgi:hypothetical protein
VMWIGLDGGWWGKDMGVAFADEFLFAGYHGRSL